MNNANYNVATMSRTHMNSYYRWPPLYWHGNSRMVTWKM